MTAIDQLTAAFECLWEAKIHLLRAEQDGDEATRADARALHNEVAATRDRVEKALIALEGRQTRGRLPQPG